ncbi:unnamed protein product [Amoebophrya sp. A120]|nr:unnamed protein product [Amoebophrya sp. A120]|eukprot:GSA120T00013046001.1
MISCLSRGIGSREQQNIKMTLSTLASPRRHWRVLFLRQRRHFFRLRSCLAVFLHLFLVSAIRMPDFQQKDDCDIRVGAGVKDLGPIGPYIDIGFFTDYKLQAWMYYFHNVTTISFLWLNTIAFANKEYILQVCPEAYMLAMILRSEERLPFQEATDSVLDLSFLFMSLLNVAARMDNNEMERQKLPPLINFEQTTWPVQVGLERLQKMNADYRLMKTQVPTVGLVLPYCQEDLSALLSSMVGGDIAVAPQYRKKKDDVENFSTSSAATSTSSVTGSTSHGSFPENKPGIPTGHITLYLYKPFQEEDSSAAAVNKTGEGGLASGSGDETSSSLSRRDHNGAGRYLVEKTARWHCGKREHTKPDLHVLEKYFRKVVIVNDVVSKPSEWEVKRYFEHVFRNYDHLDDYTIFAHPDLLEHVHFRALRNVLQALFLGNFGENKMAAGPETPTSGVDVGLTDVSTKMIWETDYAKTIQDNAVSIFDGANLPTSNWNDFLTLSHHYLHNYERVSANRVSDCVKDDTEISAHMTAREEYEGLLRNLGFDLGKLNPLVKQLNQKLFQTYDQPSEFIHVHTATNVNSIDENKDKGSTTTAAGVDPANVSSTGPRDVVPLSFYCCSQFVVSKTRLRRYPKRWYEEIARSVTIKWNHCLTSYMEIIWPLLFGTPKDYLKRQDRTELPLYLRVDNFNEQNTQAAV